MDFLSAVKALQNQECEGIRCSDWNDESVLTIWQNQWRWKVSGFTGCQVRVSDYLRDDWELVNPIPRKEKKRVEVLTNERWSDYPEGTKFFAEWEE